MSSAAASDKAADGKTPFSIKVKWAASFAVSILGILVGGYAGWLYDEGMPVFVGCFIGWLTALVLGFVVTGLTDHWLNEAIVNLKPMEWQRFKATGVQNWDLYMTVHRVQNVVNNEPLFLFSTAAMQFLYIEIEVGRLVRNDYFSVQLNKPMRTCVQQSGTFEENFRANIAPTDNTVRIKLFSQGVVKDTLLGLYDINITDQVINQGFPQKKVFNLLHNATERNVTHTDQLAGSCVMSFAPGQNLSGGAVGALEENNKLSFDHMRNMLTTGGRDIDAGAYSQWATGATQNYGSTDPYV